jgi:hypothetical protein
LEAGAGVSKAPPGEEYAGGSSSICVCKMKSVFSKRNSSQGSTYRSVRDTRRQICHPNLSFLDRRLGCFLKLSPKFD